MPPPSPIDSYLLCATSRSGSTLLCGLLESTSVAGHPQSYFRRENLHEYAAAWGISAAGDGSIDDAFVRAAQAAGSTANGVCGVRVMWPSLAELTAALGSPHPGPTPSDLELLTRSFGRTTFLHLRRADTVAQAVSWARAEQSHYWHPGERVIPGGQDPSYDRDHIRRLVARIADHEAGWVSWFADQQVVPHEIAYEDLAADPVGVTLGVLDFLGLDLPAGRAIATRHQRQADELNAAWIAQFRE